MIYISFFDKHNFTKAKQLNDIITKTCKSTHATILEIENALNALNEFVSLLGFPKIIDEELILSFSKKFAKEVKTITDPKT